MKAYGLGLRVYLRELAEAVEGVEVGGLAIASERLPVELAPVDDVRL